MWPSQQKAEIEGAGSAWLLKLPEREPRKLVAVALANKTARIIWVKLAKVPTTAVVGMPAEGMLTSGEAYRPASAAA